MVKFKMIENFPDYQISDNGNVYSSFRNIILKGGITDAGQGYKIVTLRKNNKNFTRSVHRLVAEAFIPNPDNKKEVNHIDGNTMNNNVSNLEWCTRKENANHSWSNKLQKKITGEKNHMYGRFNDKHHRSKKVCQFDMQGNLIKIWPSLMEIHRQTDFTISKISLVCNNKRQHHKNFKWTYISRKWQE